MSDVNTEGQPSNQNADQPGIPVVETTAPVLKEDMSLDIYGRKFDLSTAEGRLQAKTWGEAFSTAYGKQSTELGTLRQFYKERQPTSDESKLVQLAKEQAAQGNLDSAIDSIFNYAKGAVSDADRKIAQAEKNAALWDEYFSLRPDLATKIGRTKLKQISEGAVNLYAENQDVFKELDKFWNPLIGNEKPAKLETPSKPPVTLSGGGSSSQVKSSIQQNAAKDPERTRKSFEDIVDQRINRTRSAK